MSGRKEGAAVVGIGAVACAACCAAPVLGWIAALGLGAAAMWSLAAAVAGAVLSAVVLIVRRSRRRARCSAAVPSTVPVSISPGGWDRVVG